MLHIAMCEMCIWPQDAAKCCKNAGKFFPDIKAISQQLLIYLSLNLNKITIFSSYLSSCSYLTLRVPIFSLIVAFLALNLYFRYSDFKNLK